MKNEEEIRQNLIEIEMANVPLDEHMKGYRNALLWVLDELNKKRIN